jgi:hypothetical protein
MMCRRPLNGGAGTYLGAAGGDALSIVNLSLYRST